ncbi:hypothetical protein CspeluHIS016_0503160 [Cutaneotrichosporon spelunceum]|uniref:Pali-domain-containing protein n=1 Tax=Cutaneotrichosporon spelunceum TaxID=1672016 RepID=A0AAD3YDT7_9TREE|nr:hypothetical protein CspeluHIS016_0503160 [Cutaneotrichosporon spelunceum]
MSAGARLPGVILLLAAVILLALVSFNTPLLKTFYFLQATFSSGQYKGDLRLGTLGYCATGDINECVGPQVGYSFDLNTVLNIPKSLINIPAAVSKYLTYVLVLHIVGLGFAVIALLLALIELIPGFNLVCFPTCMASFASTATLIAFIFDLAIFFIAKGAIGKMPGARADIGASVWMTLAAWVCCSLAICTFGLANCCCSCGGRGRRDNNRDSRKSKKDRIREHEDAEDDSYYRGRRDQDMRMQAIRDEERRKYEQDLPSFQPFEREPLNPEPREDKYLYDEAAAHGTTVQGVGVGYGRRGGAPNPYAQADTATGYGQNLGVQRQPSTGSSLLTAGNAGVGAGGEGVDQPRNEYGYAGRREQMNDSYYDPYAIQNQQPYGQQYGQSGYDYNQGPTYPPEAATSPTHQRGYNDYFQGGQASTDSHHYQDPGPVIHPASADPYRTTGYDDGLGAIGRAATSPTGERQYTGAQGYGTPAPRIIPQTPTPMQVPTPQRLVNPQEHTILRSPEAEYAPPGGFNNYASEIEAADPPSYGHATGPPSPNTGQSQYSTGLSSYPHEKR